MDSIAVASFLNPSFFTLYTSIQSSFLFSGLPSPKGYRTPDGAHSSCILMNPTSDQSVYSNLESLLLGFAPSAFGSCNYDVYRALVSCILCLTRFCWARCSSLVCMCERLRVRAEPLSTGSSRNQRSFLRCFHDLLVFYHKFCIVKEKCTYTYKQVLAKVIGAFT